MAKRKVRSDKRVISNSEIHQIEKLAALGLSLAQVSSILGVSRETIYRRIREGENEISEAIYRGRAKAVSKIASKAYELALEGDTSMIKYWLSCRAGWSEKSQITIEGGENPLQVSNISDDQLKHMIHEFLNENGGNDE